jgi:hypothetical protein
MSPDWEQLFNTSWNEFWLERTTKTDEAARWGFPAPPKEFERSASGELILPEGVFRFAEFVKLPSGKPRKHHNVRELAKFLKAACYPKQFLEGKIVTEAGYEKALTDRQKANQQADAKRQRDKRKNKKPPQRNKPSNNKLN